MDRVRFGRALGYGTRHAAKTFAAALEAAAAPDPASRPTEGSPRAQTTARPPQASAAQTERPRPAVRDVRAGARNFKRSFWQPLAVFSGALWNRVTGLFFALLAITMAGGAWRLRGALHLGAAAAVPHRFWAYAIFAALFGYFAVSSFMRASLKERRAAAAAR